MDKIKSPLTIAILLSVSLYSYNVNAAEPGDTSATAPAAANDHVARAVFTNSVHDREPADTITTLGNDKNQIYFFTDLRGLAGQTVIHRWEYQGKTVDEVKFNVGGPRWRVWSSKTLSPQSTGDWRVEIIGGDGKTLGEGSFKYTAAAPTAK